MAKITVRGVVQGVGFQFLLFNARCAGSPSKKNKKDNKKNSGDPAHSLIAGAFDAPGKLLLVSIS